MNVLKKCSKCRELKNIIEYDKKPDSADGLQLKCKKCRSLENKIRYLENSQKIKEKTQEYRNKNKQRIKQYFKTFRLLNRDKRNFYHKKRHANKLKALPPWISKQQLAEIANIYKKAKQLEKETGIKHHVDHIIPLQGKEVCGLHTPWNLQILTAEENIKKGNKI